MDFGFAVFDFRLKKRKTIIVLSRKSFFKKYERNTAINRIFRFGGFIHYGFNTPSACCGFIMGE
jgi:hypothetical protein